MTRTTQAAAFSATLFLLAGCRRNAEQGVRPLSVPLESETATSSEFLPLDQVKKSQAAAIAQRIANTEITITYSRPVARGRTLFGGIVPHDQVWNPGADQATAIALTRDVQINGKLLGAGKYSVWAIPRLGNWTMIFSRAADVYHTPYPGEDRDALRVDVRPERGPHMETLSFDFPIVEGKDAVLRLSWGEVVVPLSIKVP